MPISAGTKLGPYEILASIGAGGMGEVHRAHDPRLGKLQPGDAHGVPRGLSVYHWVLREFDAMADWIEKAIDQRDPFGAISLRVWYGRELRSTPRWAGLMRKLNLPES